MTANWEVRLDQHWRPILGAILLVALALRLLWVLVWHPVVTLEGGDGPFYIALAQSLLSAGGLAVNGVPILTAGPLYPLFLAGFMVAVPGEGWLLAARLGDVGVAVGSVALLFAVAAQVFGRPAGLIAAGWLAIDGRFIAETGQIQTEGLFIFLVLLFTAVYLWAVRQPHPAWLLLAAPLLGLATLTRAIGAVLVVAAIHIVLMRDWRAVLTRLLWFGLPFVLVLTPWLVRNYQVTGRITIGEGLAGNFWLGTVVGQWEGNAAFNEAIAALPRDPDCPICNPPTEVYIRFALEYIAAHPSEYAGLMARKLVRAYIQPAGTVVIGGPSLREMVFSGDVGQAFSQCEFWPKLWMYIGHFGSLVLAGVAVGRQRGHWRGWLVLAVMIATVSGAYWVLTIIPRYLYPIMPLYIALASGALVQPVASQTHQTLA